MDNDYFNYEFIFCHEDGYPIEPGLLQKRFNRWQKNSSSLNLPQIVFHDLRHSSTTYKMDISGGNVKAVQRETGHATADIVLNTYSHYKDRSSEQLIKNIEKDFYHHDTTDLEPIEKPAAVTDDTTLDLSDMLITLLKENKDIQKKVLSTILASM